MTRSHRCKVAIFMFVIIGAYSLAAEARVLGKVGATYQFAEKDGLAEVEARARSVDWKKAMVRLQKEGNGYVPETLPRLPVASARKIRLVDPTFTLDEDIPDPRVSHGVLYPKGYKFNPLNYAPFPGEVVFLNGADSRQLEWLLRSAYLKQPSSVILLTGGNPNALSNLAGRAVYFADQKLITRLGVKAVPSVVRQRGNMYEVEEIDVKHKNTAR